MNCQEIEKILNEELQVNSRGHIRGKSPAIDKIHQTHLKAVDSALMDIRIYVAKLYTGYATKEALSMIDDFIYKKQIS